MPDEFQQMDAEAGVMVQAPAPTDVIPGGTLEYREQLIKKYHQGAKSLADRLREEGVNDNDSIVIALINEVMKETDNLLGNHLVAAENGNLRDASVISFKRGELLEKVVKSVLTKQKFAAESEIDLDSPAMLVIFKYFMQKVKDVFERMETPAEQSDIFFRSLGEETENWKKELRAEFDAMKAAR
jgi:hypothetical protein